MQVKFFTFCLPVNFLKLGEAQFLFFYGRIFHDFILLDKYFRFAIFIAFSYDWTEPELPGPQGCGILTLINFSVWQNLHIWRIYKFY